MRRFIEFLLHHYKATLAILALVTLGFGSILPSAVIATNLNEMFFNEDAAFDEYLERTHSMTNDAGLIVGIEEAAPFSPAALDRLERAVTGLRALPDVRRVTSLLDAGRLKDDGVDLTFPVYADEAREAPEQADALLQKVIESPIWSKLVISKDGKHTAMVIEAIPDKTRQAEAETELVDNIYRVFDEAGYPRQKVHLGGTAAVTAEMFEQIELNIMMIFPIVVIALFLVAFLIFRQLWPAVITMIVAIISVIWTSGFSLLLDPNVNLFLSIVPVIILVVSFSDVIHLCSAYLLELGSGKTKEDAIVATGTDVGTACFFTSVTTFIGFTALAFVPSPVMQQFGIVLGFGVGATLIIALTLVPVIFKVMKEPKAPTRGANEGAGWIGRFLRFAENVSIGKPFIVLAVTVAIIAVSGIGLYRLQIDASLLERLAYNNPVRQSARYLQEHFAGTGTMSIFVESRDDRDLMDPDRLEAIQAFQNKLAGLKDVNQVISLVDLIRITHAEMREPDDDSVLPTTRPQIGGYLMMFDMSNDETFRRSLSNDKKLLQIVLRMDTTSFRQTYALGQEIMAIGAETLGPAVTAEPGGILFFLGRWLDELIDGQKRGLLFSILTITIMMIIGLKSLRTGLWSMIPNLVPLIFLGGVLGLLFETADSDTLIVAMIAIGIGVDDTIHFLMRFRLESERTHDVATALRETFHFAGRAIVITSIILIIGFVPLNMSDYKTLVLMGTLLPMTLGVALMANLFVVPAMAEVGLMRFKMKTKPTEDAETIDRVRS